MAKKDANAIMEEQVERRGIFNPLLMALRENDKNNRFSTNVSTAFHKTGFPLIDYYFGSVINIHDNEGRIVRQEPRVGQAAGTFNLIIGNTGSGKALPNDAFVVTPSGHNTMGELRVGDEVIGSDGKPTEIVGVFPQGIKPCYNVKLNDGRTTECSGDHLWTVYDTVTNETMTLTTKEILDRGLDYLDESTNTLKLRYGIPNLSGPVMYDEIDTFEIDHIYNTGLTCEDENYRTIPYVFMVNDVNTRLVLLKGLMDAHGKCIDDESVVFETKSQRMNYILRTLIRSLGYGCENLTDTSVGIDLKAYPQSVVLTAPKEFIDQLRIKGNKEMKYIYWNTPINVTLINSIEKTESKTCTCIKVAASDELFLTGDFMLTHNTTLAMQIAGNIVRQYKYANVIHYDCENRMDISRCETTTGLPSHYFHSDNGERYMLIQGAVGLDVIQEMIVKTYCSKMRLKKELMVESGYNDEFGNPVMIFEPTVVIIDSITTVINETFSPDNSKEAANAEKMRGNTEGARDAKTLKGFFKDILPLCKEANIIIYGINHINSNMSMNSFTPVAKQQNFLKQDESIPGGRTMLYYPYNIIKLVARPSDDFNEESDGFAGHIVMFEPVKCSSNQSGNNSKGISFEMVFTYKKGFDSLRSLVLYGKDYGIIEGNKTRLKFKDDDSFTFTLKNIYKEKNEKPIWENIKKYVIPHLLTHLPFVEPEEFDERSLDY